MSSEAGPNGHRNQSGLMVTGFFPKDNSNFALKYCAAHRISCRISSNLCANAMPDENVKREKFVKLAGGRVQAALNAIRKIGNLSNRRSYVFDENDVRKIVKALREAVAETEHRFDPSSSTGKKTFKL